MVNRVDIAVADTPGLASILVPCCGMLEYTKLCVPNVLRWTRPPFELIFLDIGSLDGTAEYLSGVKAASQGVRIEIVRTQNDLGIGEVCKEALAAARGEYVVLLNNDTVVTQGWLNSLAGLAKMSAGIGLVGPMSNYAAPPQLVETVPYRMNVRTSAGTGRFGVKETLLETEEMHAFAREFRDQHKGKWVEAERLGGFCLLVKRQVLERIGPVAVDPWTDLGLFDTDILSAKARQAGFTLTCCRDLFVHHFGTRTFSHGAPIGSLQEVEGRSGGGA